MMSCWIAVVIAPAVATCPRQVLNICWTLFCQKVYKNVKIMRVLQKILYHYTPIKNFQSISKCPLKFFWICQLSFQELNTTQKKNTGFKRISAEKCFLIYVWYATHEAASFRDVADRFNIAISTLYTIIENVGLFLSNKSNSYNMAQ
ncbi:hypothetical protein NQ314_012000 [Rhamnusium bicolor]|uniref:Transposase Helix-turn-helix domain-containing protein n=1 Tax=Rhamnusium bicolor TaxID=1586634 RepID=A0AAV8XFP6_9CUCU|nr:hypothetical protein NQ314_012000 [Rhamnusium bicolor]